LCPSDAHKGLDYDALGEVRLTGQKVLVLGATGLIGSAVALRLAPENEVHGVSRASNAESARRLEESGIRLIRMDAVDGDLATLDSDYDYVINEVLMSPHLCASDADGAFRAHAFLNARLLERSGGCKGIVLGSTGSVYRPSAQPVDEDAPLGRNPFEDLENYVLSKICGDKLALYYSETHGVPAAILRYYHPYDATSHTRIGSLAVKIARGDAIRADESLVNPIFTEDTAEFTIRAAGICASPPVVINIGGEAIVSVKKLAEMVGEAMGKPPAFGPPTGSASDSWVCDNAKRIELLGRETVPLEEGIRRAVAACEAGFGADGGNPARAS
jgi:nucleoside-diphosphate-sugar epimerase